MYIFGYILASVHIFIGIWCHDACLQSWVSRFWYFMLLWDIVNDFRLIGIIFWHLIHVSVLSRGNPKDAKRKTVHASYGLLSRSLVLLWRHDWSFKVRLLYCPRAPRGPVFDFRGDSLAKSTLLVESEFAMQIAFHCKIHSTSRVEIRK